MNPLITQIDYLGIWHIAWFTGLTLAVILFISKEKIDFSLKFLWGYSLIYALYIFEFPGLLYGHIHTAFQATAGQAFAELLLIPYLAIHYSKWIWRFFPVVIFYTILSVWMKWDGLLIAPSFNTAFLALYFPFASLPLQILSLLTLLTHHGSTALLILGAGFLPWAFQTKRRALLFGIGVLTLFGIAYFHSHGAYLDGEERLTKWSHYFNFWIKNPKLFWFLGTGPGSFMWLSLMVDEFKNPAFLTMHSDLLQILFELGILGFCLSLWGVMRATKRNPSGILGCVAFSLTYHPLRFFPTALLVALIFSFKSKDKY